MPISPCAVAVLPLLFFAACSLAAQVSDTPAGRAVVFSVVELQFTGPTCTPADRPAVDVELSAEFVHEAGQQRYRISGFWDGDGQGGPTGNVFKIRFCPTLPGVWTLAKVNSNNELLNGQRQGQRFIAEATGLKGFWLPGGQGNQWWVRSDGSHPYIVGNTHYVFLSRPNGKEQTLENIRADIDANARYFNKLRMLLKAFPEPNGSTTASAFFTPDGQPTNNEGDAADQVRPNPAFYHRVDAAVQRGLEKDMIIDLILGSTQHIKEKMARTPTYLRYIAARYGAYPNVWITLANEYSDQYDDARVVETGDAMRALLPYPTPLSIHDWHGPWNKGRTGRAGINGDWCTHSIRQGKMPKHKEVADMHLCADGIIQDRANNLGKPAMNDENGYYGEEATPEDIIEGVLGTFIGGGYGTTGYRTTGIMKGPYYWGFASEGLDIAANPVVHMLAFFREKIDQNVRFWEMTPAGKPANSIFTNVPETFRAMHNPGHQYLLASDAAAQDLTAKLPPGQWKVVQWDLVKQTETVIHQSAQGSLIFSTPNSRATLTLFTRPND